MLKLGWGLGASFGTELRLGDRLGCVEGPSTGWVDGRKLGERLGLEVAARKTPQIPSPSTKELNADMKGSVYHDLRMSPS